MYDDSRLDDILGEIKKSYITAYQDKLCEVILYGSYARGDQNPESDIDVVAIVNDNRLNVQNALKQVWKDAADIGLEHDVIVSPLAIPLSEYQEYQDVYLLYKKIRDEGVIIYPASYKKEFCKEVT